MAHYLLDTNIVLRFSNPSDGQHALVTAKINHILTLNPNDFSGVSDITIVRPQDIS